MAVTPSFYLTFGMVVVPVKSYVAARDERVEFTNLHAPCQAKLKQQKICSACQKVVADEEIVKGYALDRDRYVLVSPEELEGLAAEKSKTMEIKAFVPWEEVDPVYLGPANYLGPADQAAARSFALLRDAMGKSGRAALVQYIGSGRDKLGLIRPVDNALMLHEAFYPSEVRSFVAQNRIEVRPVTVSKEELALAVKLVESLAKPFNLSGYADGYQTRVTDLIQARISGAPAPKLEMKAAPSPVVDLMAALKESLAAREAATPAAKAAKAGKRKKQAA